MPFFSNKRKDFSIQPPKQEVSSIPFFVTDSSNIDFTFLNNNLTADLTLTGVVAGTYGDASNIPVLQIDQWGRITGVTLIPVSGGGSTYTVDNGLTENPSGNFQLGSTISGGAPLLHDTYIDTLSDKTIFLEGQKTNQLEYILNVSNTANDGGALRVTSLGLGIAITATSVSASAVAANSTNAPAIAASTGGSNEAGLFTNSDAGTNNIVQGIRLRHSSSGVPTVGFGVAAEFSGKTTLNSDLRLGRLSFVWEDAITASRTSKFQIHTVNSAIEEIKAEILGNGKTKLNKYGSGTFTGTAAYYAAWDANGNFIEEPIPGGGGGSQLNEPTGILFGGNLSASIGGTTFDLTAGIGQIVTQTSTISGVSTTVTSVSWAAATAVPITNISTAPFTYVLIDNTGTIIQQTTPFTDAQYKTHIVIGIVCHIDLATVNLVTNTQNVAYQDPYRLVEMIRLFGPIKKTGMVISANGANLRVDRTAGEVFKIGSNYTTAAFEPDVDTISAATPAQLCRVHRDGLGGFVFDTNGGAYYNFIEPNFWDDGSGTIQGVPSNRWTIQRLFMFPNNPNDIICYYGIQLYNNFSEARAGVEFETFDEAQITAENAVFLGYLFVKHNATDLSDPNEAAFLQAGLFRGIPPGGGGSGGGGTVLTDDSIQGDGTLGNEIKLVNDAASPGPYHSYRTDGTGTKGWYPGGNISSIFHADATPSPTTVGAPETILRSVFIPKGTLQVGDVVRVSVSYVRPVASGNVTMRWWLGPNPTDVIGATNFMQYGPASSTSRYIGFQFREGIMSATQLRHYGNALIPHDLYVLTGGPPALYTIPNIITDDMYFHFVGSAGTGLAELFLESSTIEILRTA